MDEPWGLSGPDFLVLYAFLLALPLAVALVGRLALASGGNRAATAYTPGNVYEVAFLAGGADRVVDTAVASLLERGLARADSTGRVRGVGNPPADPVELAVHKVIVRRSSSKMPDLRRELRKSQVLRGMTKHLTDAGLIRPTGGRVVLRRAVYVLYLLILALGVLRLVNGIVRDRPVGFLVFLVVAAAIATFVAAKVAKSAPPVRPTAQGSVQLASARSWQSRQSASAGGGPARSSAAVPMLAGAAGAVALGGMMMYPDEEMRTALAAPSAGGSSGGDGGGGGSSCGGGGGGCGGCGGCGG
ncbi:TIGR04222 domain-containing membrane protein [Amycolatopsis sp. 195334CR]|uniref:TIGR04222 domain-containing membrane protein n=1 Tax=Amycolatopsis sp. 195334CR TaxID=2814588 RepID=UPI001A8C4D51|nr:TIGR04222 domain-containing membrane protein [Amycolatopsis sp. 195334CR]MBN6038768.1 TIGR04222 domain-containing membrane protein [Amycolatopsis sp. 195334CR]